MDYGYLGCIIWLIFCLFGLSDHNKKLEEMFPDDNNPQHRKAKMELHISFYGFGILLIVMIGFFIRSCLGG